MPLHLLGKKSWNVYNAANIARVKADEEAAAAREAEEERRMQELDAERRAAILRGRTPPPLPEIATQDEVTRRSDKPGQDRKRHRRLAGEDDTDRDIRLAKDVTAPRGEEDAAIFKLRKPNVDAPLEDHAGHINLFPVDEKEAIRRKRNAERESEKKKKERELEDQYTMRFSNAAGREGLERPWYAADRPSRDAARVSEDRISSGGNMLEFPGLENKDVWGREDPRRKEREALRISSNDPLVIMQQAQWQLDQVKRERKAWEEKKARELEELKAAQKEEERRERHSHRSSRHRHHRSRDRDGRRKSSDHERRRHRSRSYSPDRHRDRHQGRDRSDGRHRERDRDRDHERRRERSSHREKHRSSRDKH